MKIGIIGLGYWGKHYVRLINNNPTVKLVALCDINQNNLDKFSYLNVNYFTDYKELFKSKLIDTVIIVTIAKEHYKIILKALEYNLNIFVEKPIVTNLNDCIKIKSSMNNTNTKLMTGYTYLFNPKIEYICNYIKGNNLDIKSIHFEWTCFGPIRNDVSPILDLGVHPISILLKLFPNDEFHKFNTYSTNTKNTYFISFNIKDIIIFINLSWSNPGKTRKMIINDESTKIVFDDVSNINPISIYTSNKSKANSDNPQPIMTDGDIIIPEIEDKEPLKEQINYFINDDINDDINIGNIDFSIKLMKIIDKINI